MDYYFAVTLIAQSISSILIGVIMFYFANTYKQSYLYYWSYSFFSLSVFLSSAFLSFLFQINGFAFDSWLKLINVLVLSLSSYLQIAFLVLGTQLLISNKRLSRNLLYGTFSAVLVFALFVTFYKAWSIDDGSIRYLLRIGMRYLIAGIVFIATALYLLKNQPNPVTGKKIVIASFIIYGLEMMTLSLITIDYFIDGSNSLLFTLVSYHGLFELMIYPMIAIGLVMWLLDVERERGLVASNALYHLNKTDGLTGLPNRQALVSFFKTWLIDQPENSTMTLTVFGVDKLHRINDAEGIKKTDQLLIKIAKRVELLFHDSPFAGRLHGDIFIGVLKDYSDVSLKKSEQIRRSLSETINTNQYSYQLRLSAGVVKVKVNSQLDDLLYKANISLQSAKESGGNCSVVYKKGLTLTKVPDIQLENELREAYKQNQFEMYYQPIWCPKKQKILSFEALIRWNHPSKGLLAPGAFMHAVIQMNRMKLLDAYVLKAVIKQISFWQKQGLSLVPVAINLSPDSLEGPELIESIQYLSQKYEVNKSLITIEVTENTAMKNIESGKNTLTELSNLGVNIAIDDFGTGYSSLNYLKTFPSDYIKFDRSFITHIIEDDINHEILKSLVPLCQRLNKKVIIEGVEKQEQAKLLMELNIAGFQGYLYSYPASSDLAAKMLLAKTIIS